MAIPGDFFYTEISPCKGYYVVIEDDLKVCYGYLIDRTANNIVSDIWLYNHQKTPENPDWTEVERAPFLNCRAFVNEEKMSKPLKQDDNVFIGWAYKKEDNSELQEVHILILRSTYAKMVPGIRPGWTIAASQDGPVAKVWQSPPN